MPVRRRESSSTGPRLPRLQQRRPQAQSRTDLYKGFVPFDGCEPAREEIENLDREQLWRKYISCRKPVVINGLVQEEAWQAHRWTDLSYLRQVAGDALVKIEPVDSTRDRFGTAAKRKVVSFSTFLDMLEDPKSAGKWYMTTQYDEEEDDDSCEPDIEDLDSVKSKGDFCNGTTSAGSEEHIKIDESLLPPMDFEVSLPAPTNALAHLFPLPGPSIMGDLVLQQCNLWLGNGKSGKSSGLHHDFHDNLYMLLSGRKRFLIWPPIAHRWLEPTGKVETVHPNGLIEYTAPGEASLQADGLTRLEAMRWLFRARLRALLEADEKAARANGDHQLERTLRKGKGKQTEEQERLILKLREAEVELLLLEAEEGGSTSASGSDVLSVLSNDPGSIGGITESDLGTDDDLYEDDNSSNASDDTEVENSASDASSIRDTKVNGMMNGIKKRTQSGKIASNDGCRDEDGHREKKKRRIADKLIIPKGGLPGGLRGSLEDLEGDFDSGSDEFADEDLDGDAIYVEGGMSDEEDTPEGALVSQSMRNAVAARMRAMAEGRLIVEAGDDSSEEGTSQSGSESDNDESEHGVIRQITTMAEVTNGVHNESSEEESDDDDDDGASWPSLDDEAIEEGEAALEKLARLQELQEGISNGKSKSHRKEEDPKSFSRISPKILQWYFNKSFDPAVNEDPKLFANDDDDNQVQLLPRFECPHPMEIHLQAGQMLYLPASWYHEVTSYSDPQEPNGVHMALNYWLHPPTAIGKPTPISLQSKGGSTTRRLYNDSTRPYLNVEAWNEIRRCVNKKVDMIRYKAAQAAAEKLLIVQQQA